LCFVKISSLVLVVATLQLIHQSQASWLIPILPVCNNVLITWTFLKQFQVHALSHNKVTLSNVDNFTQLQVLLFLTFIVHILAQTTVFLVAIHAWPLAQIVTLTQNVSPFSISQTVSHQLTCANVKMDLPETVYLVLH
jgi:hypothetical protein